MKNFITIALLILFGLNSYSQGKKDGSFSLKAEISFEKTIINYGVIDKGSDGVREFIFTNTGDAPLVISKVNSSCGCTIPKKPEKPILPGESDKIQVKYDTQRVGLIRKSISVTSNASNPSVILKITGEVINDNNINGTEESKKSILEEYN
tara:strand:+ start:43326 stop:43778 length:453 start_codon:yes stop_codon:yes gene_type:complete